MKISIHSVLGVLLLTLVTSPGLAQTEKPPFPPEGNGSERVEVVPTDAEGRPAEAPLLRDLLREGRRPPPDDLANTPVEGLIVLERLLRMSPEELERIQRAIDRIEAMEPAQRERLHRRVQMFLERHRQEGEQALRNFEEMGADRRDQLRQFMFQLSPRERREVFRRFRQIPQEERQRLLFSNEEEFEEFLRELREEGSPED